MTRTRPPYESVADSSRSPERDRERPLVVEDDTNIAEMIVTGLRFVGFARDRREDAIVGLTVGGDDYINKPFSLDEVRRANSSIDLSATEFALLRYLLENSGRVVSKAQIGYSLRVGRAALPGGSR